MMSDSKGYKETGAVQGYRLRTVCEGEFLKRGVYTRHVGINYK